MQPKGLGGLSGRDSFSACQRDDIFSHIRNPRMQAPSSVELKKDTQETSEQDTFNRMANQQQSVPVYLFVKSGKFFVLVLILPAHLLLVKVPRWMIAHVMPKIMQMTNSIASHCRENLNKFVQNIAKQAQIIVALTESLKAFGTVIKSSFEKLAGHLLSPFKKAANETLQALSKASKSVTAFLSSQFNHAKAFVNHITGFLNKVRELVKISEKLKLERSYSLEFSLEKYLSPLKLKLESAFDLLKQATERLNSFKNKILNRLKPVVEEINSKCRAALKALNKVKQTIIETISPKLEWVAQHIQSAVQVLSFPITLSFGMIMQMNAQVALTLRRSKSLRRMKAGYASLKKIVSKIEVIQTAILKSFERLRKEVTAQGKKLTKKLINLLAKASKKGVKYQKKAAAAVKILISNFRSLTRYFLNIFRKISRFFINFYKLCRIMAKFTLYLLREIFRELKASTN